MLGVLPFGRRPPSTIFWIESRPSELENPLLLCCLRTHQSQLTPCSSAFDPLIQTDLNPEVTSISLRLSSSKLLCLKRSLKRRRRDKKSREEKKLVPLSCSLPVSRSLFPCCFLRFYAPLCSILVPLFHVL